jgi:integrase
MHEQSLGRVDQVTRAQASRARRQKIADLTSGHALLDPPARMTLEQFLKYDRESSIGNVKASTILQYEVVAKHAIAALGSKTDVRSIKPVHVTRIRKYLTDRGLGLASIRKTLVTLHGIFNRGMQTGLIERNPFAGQRLPKPQVKTKRIFNLEEIDAMVQAAPSDWWKAFLVLAVTTGFRRNELLMLQWENIDFENGLIHVVPKRAGTFRGPDSRQYPIIEWTPKNSETRSVPLEPNAAKLLTTLRSESDGSGYVFLSLERLARIQPKLVSGATPADVVLINNLNKQFREIQDEAAKHLATKKRISVSKLNWVYGSPHDLRKTFGSIMAQHLPMHELKELMGHAKIDTTAAYYLKVSESMPARVRQAFGELDVRVDM